MASKLTCVVTGASRGIGLATATRFARAGANLGIAARNAKALEAAAREIQKLGAACEALPADVSDPHCAKELISIAVARFGRVDVLVNNAGHAVVTQFGHATPEDFDALIRGNVAPVFHVSRAAWPVMQRQGGGVIVSVSSMASIDPFPGLGIYGACKAWINLFTKAIAEEGRPHGIRAFAVAPGAVETDMLREHFPDVPAENCLSPDDVAQVIESLCGDSMKHATGQTIFVRK